MRLAWVNLLLGWAFEGLLGGIKGDYVEVFGFNEEIGCSMVHAFLAQMRYQIPEILKSSLSP